MGKTVWRGLLVGWAIFCISLQEQERAPEALSFSPASLSAATAPFTHSNTHRPGAIHGNQVTDAIS